MKSRSFIIVAAALTAFTVSAFAGGAVLSPRAAGNEIKIVSGTAGDPNLATLNHAVATPRVAGNQAATVPGVANNANPAAACRNMGGAPKAMAECASHPGAAMPCCAAK